MSVHLSSQTHGDAGGDSSAVALVASGNEWSVRSLESILGAQGIKVVRAMTAEEAVAQAEAHALHAVLVDADVPGLSGLELCQALRGMPSVGAGTPIILLRPRPWRRDERFEALRAGAWECIGIPADSEELLLQLRTYISAKKEADAIRDAGLIDPLTGAYNAAGILRRVNELGSDAIRYSRPLGCVALSPRNLDGAAPAGDEASAEPTIALLRQVSRSSDVIGRIGPTEFAILAPNAGPDGTLRLAARVLAAADSVPASAAPRLDLRAGYFAVDDLRAMSIPPVELVRRAAAALHQSTHADESTRLNAYSAELTAYQN